MSTPSNLPSAGNAALADPSKIENRKSRIERVLAYRPLLVLALVVFVCDQLTKLWIAANVPFDPMHSHSIGNDSEVIGGCFYIIHVGNTGAAWSMFSGQSVWLAVLAITRISSAAGICAALSAPIAAALFDVDALFPLLLGFALLVVWKHRENIARLIAGTEPRVGKETSG